eukprot:556432-Pelagomonas_calceolata.AAC.2
MGVGYWHHRTRKKRKKKKNYKGGGNPLYINSGKGDTLAQKSRESPPTQSYKIVNARANGDLEYYWKHPAP